MNIKSFGIPRVIRVFYRLISVPFAIFFILDNKKIHKAYNLNIFQKYKLGFRMYFNSLRIETGSSFQAHLVMALKILETGPDIKGDIVECGTWKGGSAANLSLVCKIAGRKLRIYDSFEGLPEATPGDRTAISSLKGAFCGHIDEVKSNIQRYGEIECCEFIKGFYNQTMEKINGPILLAYLDVDYEASIDICLRSIWPNLAEKGYIFIDEYMLLDYCSLFFSEKYWKKYFNRTPPGLIGAGSGLSLGIYYVGPWIYKLGDSGMELPTGPAYTRKDFSCFWSYYSDEQ